MRLPGLEMDLVFIQKNQIERDLVMGTTLMYLNFILTGDFLRILSWEDIL
jgi:hypothetical protein